MADALFPPTDDSPGGRSFNKSAYQNRRWAFAEKAVAGDEKRLSSVGNEIDRVVTEVNADLHADQPKTRVASAICDTAKLTATLFAMNPDAAKNGYLAYTDSLRAFVRELRETNSISG